MIEIFLQLSYMRFLYSIIIVVLWTSVSFFRGVFAHPLDVSNTTLTLYESEVSGVTYLHPVELDRILILSWWVDPARVSVDMYYHERETFFRYLSESIQFENQGELCQIGNFEVMEWLLVDEIFRNGFPISYTFSCQKKIQDPRIIITICNEVQLQTNRLYIYEAVPGSSPQKRDYRVLNGKKNSHILRLNSLDILQDSDHDGLPDEDEILYGTSVNNSDTDGDGYTDREEIDKSWNPLSSELSPGQKRYNLSSSSSWGYGVSGEVHNLSDVTSVWWGQRFGKILTDIRVFIDQKQSVWFLFWLLVSVGVLGFIHALGPGHSKGILISQILDKHISLGRVVAYAGIFSFVHILDIVVVVLISKFLLRVFDPWEHLWTIQWLSILAIMGLSIYLFISSYLQYKKRVITSQSGSGYIFLAILSGLTPCAFWWSIFLLLFAVKRLDLALPLLLSLWLWIFLCLVWIGLLTYFLKERIYWFSPRIGTFSPMISSFFLFSISSYLLIQYL